MNDFIRSKGFKVAVMVTGGITATALVFGAGVSVGFHKARFAAQWGGNYEKNFGFEREGRDRNFGRQGMMRGARDLGQNFLPPLPGNPGSMMNSHGVAGQILSIGSTSLAVKDIDGIEKTVSFASTTPVSEGWNNASVSSLKIDDKIMVIGQASSTGQIQAKFIRVMPK